MAYSFGSCYETFIILLAGPLVSLWPCQSLIPVFLLVQTLFTEVVRRTFFSSIRRCFTSLSTASILRQIRAALGSIDPHTLAKSHLRRFVMGMEVHWPNTEVPERQGASVVYSQRGTTSKYIGRKEMALFRRDNGNLA